MVLEKFPSGNLPPSKFPPIKLPLGGSPSENSNKIPT